jgi:hypothetical protein
MRAEINIIQPRGKKGKKKTKHTQGRSDFRTNELLCGEKAWKILSLRLRLAFSDAASSFKGAKRTFSILLGISAGKKLMRQQQNRFDARKEKESNKAALCGKVFLLSGKSSVTVGTKKAMEWKAEFSREINRYSSSV